MQEDNLLQQPFATAKAATENLAIKQTVKQVGLQVERQAERQAKRQTEMDWTIGPTVGVMSHQGLRGDANDDSCDFFTVRCGFPVHRGLPMHRGLPIQGRPYADAPADGDSQTDIIYVGVIADGVSATKSGTEASRIATSTVRAQLEGGPQRMETLSKWLESAVEQANDEILFEARRLPVLANMSTTIVVAALAGPKLYVMHLGDSRAYLLRNDRICQLTADHTWTEEAVASGTITVEEAASHPARNQLQRFLGAKSAVHVDRGVIDPTTQLHEEYLLIEPGDAILLCSDGVHGRLAESEIHEVIRNNGGYPQDGVEELIATALHKGEHDDITAVLIELPPEKKVVPVEVAPISSINIPQESPQTKSFQGLLLGLTAIALIVLASYFLYFQ